MSPDKTTFNMNQSKHTSMQRIFLLSLLFLESLLPSTVSAFAVQETSKVITVRHTQPHEVHSSGAFPTHLLFRREQSEGSACPDSEGQWNCMRTRWQRCASGHWSVVMDMSEGTVCEPSGLTYEFNVDHGNSGSTSDAAPSAGTPSQARGAFGSGVRGLTPLMMTAGFMVLGLWREGYLG
ncbi:hypothetical protein F5X68DRAFT_213592 [Plectosphaerella plurivora]|uniref:Uncharacterized protein n=1 Tax=Plectosphaerella plurivora TaxID=936078 RepID=A0A9P8V6P2_9PEZI|nr:hypothetical protein F5X68DRAFT_213592 [Plectosphaerella plurivora]